MNKINSFLDKMRIPIFIIVITTTIILFTTLFVIIYTDVIGLDIDTEKSYSIDKANKFWGLQAMYVFMMTIIFMPLIETLIFQTLLYNLLILFNSVKNNSFILISISALIFGVSHSFHPFIILQIGIAGFFLMFAYILKSRSRNQFDAYLIVFGIHALRNIVPFIYKII